MSYITISKSLSVNHLHRLKRRWQRGLAIEHAFIVLLIALSAFNSCLSSVPRSASWRPRRLAFAAKPAKSLRPFWMSNFLGRSGCRSTVARCRCFLRRHPELKHRECFSQNRC